MIKCEFEERRLIYDGWENTELQPLEICAKQSLKTMTLFMLGEGRKFPCPAEHSEIYEFVFHCPND